MWLKRCSPARDCSTFLHARSCSYVRTKHTCRVTIASFKLLCVPIVASCRLEHPDCRCELVGSFLAVDMTLREMWTHAAPNRMAPKEQCKLWALRQVIRKNEENDKQYDWMASQVTVVGGGHPGRDAVRQFFERVDAAGQGWYPGYCAGKKRGRPVELTTAKRSTIAKSMMAAKKRGAVPCYETAVHRNPKATLNESTKKPFSRPRINEVLTTDCYDERPEKPWEFRFGAKRRALTAGDKELRMNWARRLRREGHTAAWFRDNVVWVDICSKVIPGNPQKALDQELAAKNKKRRLMSPGSLQASQNLGGSSTADKQCSYGDTRVFFFVALTRGVFGVKVFTKDGEFPGETPQGARLLVNNLPGLLRKMLGPQAKMPRTIFSDRGPGFYHRKWGTITGDYESACRSENFKPWAGSNSKAGPRAQPPDIGDVLLHETAIAWLRRQEEKSRPTAPWQETTKELERRLQKAVKHINATHDVRGLCMEFNQRLSDLVHKTMGDRLPK